MTVLQSDLNALLGSRICHDLISPLGAIGNGVELLQLSRDMDGPELALISESVENANIRIRFFRVAFGAARAGQEIGAREIGTILAPGADGRKIEIDWQPAGEMPRPEVKLAFLLLLCLESAMPWGGQVRVSRDGDDWRIAAEAEKLKMEPELWDLLTDPATEVDLTPAQVHFALVAPELALQKRTLALTITEAGIIAEF